MNWENIIEQERQKDYFIKLQNEIDSRYENSVVYPPKELIYSAFTHTKYDDLKVVILGQDPYHDANQAQGLAFSTPSNIPNPPSMRNILKEIKDDTGVESIVNDGNLAPWSDQGVMLLNTILTVEAHKPKSHHNMGWEIFTDEIIKHINENFENIIFLLWGASAISKSKIIDNSKHHLLTATHPSPLSSYRGFFGCKHFSKTNEILKNHKIEPIIW